MSKQTTPLNGQSGLNGSATKPVHVFVQLDAMPNVPENWDGYGGGAPTREAIDAARSFLHTLAQFEIGCRLLPQTLASPTRTGGILLEWENGPHQLEVEIDSSKRIAGAYLNTATDQGETFTLDAEMQSASRFLELGARSLFVLEPLSA